MATPPPADTELPGYRSVTFRREYPQIAFDGTFLTESFRAIVKDTAYWNGVQRRIESLLSHDHVVGEPDPTILAERLYQAFRIPDTAWPQLHGFTLNAATQRYQAVIRREIVALGYPDRAIKLTDQSVLADLDAHARQVADSIVKTYNRMLRNQITRDPQGIVDYLKRVDKWNREVLVPSTSRY